jgi:hypothetical protein
MSNPTVTIHNVETGEIITRDMNAEELEQWTIEKAANDAIKATESAKAHERAALLERLGITEEEAALLLGGN